MVFGESFQGIKPGDKVTFRDRSGREHTAKVNPLLIFATHVVVNYGNFGEIVDRANYVDRKPGSSFSERR